MKAKIYKAQRLQRPDEWIEGELIRSDINKRERESGKATLIFTPDCETFIHVPEYHDSFMVKEDTIREFTGLTDSNGKRIFEGDTVSFCGMEGEVVFCAGAFGIATKENIDYDHLCREIAEWCGADNTEHFSYCDNFISFWELIWNFGHDDNSCPSVTVIGNIVN